MNVNKFINRKVVGALSVMVLFWLSSCENNSQLGNYLVQTSTRCIKIDTFAVRASILAKDSIITSGKNLAFVGNFDDPLIGYSTASSFIEFSRTSDNETDLNFRFDSIALELNPNSLHYGDTVPPPAIKISRLSKKIEMADDGTRYSSSPPWPTVEELPIIKPFRWKGPHEKKIILRLPDDLGRKMLNGIVRATDEYNNDNFLDTFSGLALEPAAGNNCIYGFSVSDSACRIVIYYHLPGDEQIDKEMVFKANYSKMYSTMHTDLLPIYPKDSKAAPVPTSQTGNMGVVMSGPAALYTRLDFLGIEKLKNYGEIVVIEAARLVVKPVRRSYDEIPLPRGMTLFTLNPYSNQRTSTPAIGSTQSGKTVTLPVFDNNADREIHENNFYQYDITDFIASQINPSDNDKLSISVDMPDGWTSGAPPDSTTFPFQRIVFGNQNFMYQNSDPKSIDSRIMLEITYSIYNEYIH